LKSHWDHAFASGSVYKEPGRSWAFLGDLLFHLVEKWYGNYCIRRIWRAWKKASACEGGVRLGGKARLINKNHRDAVRIGEKSVCKGIIRVERAGKLVIGNEVYLGDNSIISSAESVVIGSGTLVAHGVQIFDNTSHPLGWQERQDHFRKLLGQRVNREISIPSAPVTIGEHCWLGMGAVVLKGVTIGDRSVIGAGCVVTKNIPPDTLVVSPEVYLIDMLKNGVRKG